MYFLRVAQDRLIKKNSETLLGVVNKNIYFKNSKESPDSLIKKKYFFLKKLKKSKIIKVLENYLNIPSKSSQEKIIFGEPIGLKKTYIF